MRSSGFPRQFGIWTALYPFARRIAFIGIAFGLAVGVPAVAAAQEKAHVLSASGAALGTIESAGILEDLRITVNVGADPVESTHVWAVLGGAELRQRTTNGYWVPWSGDLDKLADAHFVVTDGRISFKIVDGSIAADNQGITIVVGYRTGGTLKYGALGIVPKGGS